MNLLWMCNIELPMISEALQKQVTVGGGWLDVLSRKLVKDGHKLSVIYPQSNIKTVQTKKIDSVTIFQIPHSKKNDCNYDKAYEGIFNKVLKEDSFDCIHIWGTEFPRTLAMLKACEENNLLDKAVVEIQGIKHFIAKNYYASLPLRVIWSTSLNDMYFRNGIKRGKRLYELAGKYELESIRKTKNIIGRTDWDLASVKSINPLVKYYKCNLILRELFYQQKWELNNCEKHSIFVSSYSTPVKGLHYVLEALPIILQKFPQAQLYIVSTYTYKPNLTFWETIKINSYGKHIYNLIRKYGLENNVTFLGRLNETEMLKRFLNSHVYISASAMENSPNTVAEAMALGVPVVASLVGGVSSMVTHQKDGLIYQYDAPYMMAHYVNEIFKSDNVALSLSRNGRRRAEEAYDIDKNYSCLLKVYETLSDEGKDI